MILRDYQNSTLNELHTWLDTHKTGNPCVVLPTGAGKSLIIAALCRDWLMAFPAAKILMLTHVKELIAQNAEKLQALWSDAPLGVCSAGLGRKELDQQITFAGIQSVHNKAAQLAHQDIVIIDECHLLNHKSEGIYHKLIHHLSATNPALRVIGLTATPYRLGHGFITDKPALFDALLEPVGILTLVEKGYLAPLRSKSTAKKLSADGVALRGGEYVESALQKAVDTSAQNAAVASEIVARAGDRRSWLLFCAGVDHAYHMRDALRALGVVAETVTGKTPRGERDALLEGFKTEKIQALTNANVLTTGFDAPNIDLIALLRPTMSTGLYIQMAGRGLRPKEHTDHCLVLDFAGAVERHGPITDPLPPRRKGERPGDAPVKVCPQCAELLHLSAKSCSACGYEFPPAPVETLTLSDLDIMGETKIVTSVVKSWRWRRHTSAAGNDLLRVSYYGSPGQPPINEYLNILHGGYIGARAVTTLACIVAQCGGNLNDMRTNLSETADFMNTQLPPARIRHIKDGKFYKVIDRTWEMDFEQAPRTAAH